MTLNHILLVEDSLDDAELVILSLSTLNDIIDSITHVKDGEEAIEYLFAKGRYIDRNRTDIPSLILLDLKMPKIGGIEVLNILRQKEEFKYIPIVIFTSSCEYRDIKNSFKNGANSYIQKPVDGYEFDKTLKEIANYWMRLNMTPNKKSN